MAKTTQQQQQLQLMVFHLTICALIASVLMKVDSVSALSIPLDGSGSVQQQADNNVQAHSYSTHQAQQEPKYLNTLADDYDDDVGDILKEKSFSDDLTRNQLDCAHPSKGSALVKRAPGGFVGMRGKKLYMDDDGNSENNENLSNNLPWNQLHDSNEDVHWDQYAQTNVRRFKKTPTAFYGVRGKKFVNMDDVNSNNDNHRWQEFLQKLREERIRDAILQDFVERLAGKENDLTNDFAKRAPNGFTGVRGKRPFLGEFDSSMEALAKRGLGNNAFVGVRGKKDVSHQAFKRSPSRPEYYSVPFWKKSLTGRNGKRQNLNNKFIAVRGKKTSYDETSPSAAFSLLYSKRTPNGFLGMRGKRPFATGDI